MVAALVALASASGNLKSFDQLVGTREQRRGDFEAETLRRHLVWFEHWKVTQGNRRPPSLGCLSEVLLQSADVENFDRAVKAFEA